MKKKIRIIGIGILALAGLSLLLYPTLSDQWNNWQQSRIIRQYEASLEPMTPEAHEMEWEKAEAFRSAHPTNDVYGDVFGTAEKDLGDTEYWQVLNPDGDGVMGYLSIPKIQVKLAIYHGTGEEVLQTGVGHLNGTGLPIGGTGNHCVLATHRGLPRARLFTDLDQLEPGDRFYIHVLDETLAYEVDQILPMVERNDTGTLSRAMETDPEQDQVTLFTCTPYGVNSHRLLVRGTRVAYEGEDEEAQTLSEAMAEAVQSYGLLYLIPAAAFLLLLLSGIRFRRKKRGSEEEKRDEK